MWEQKLELYDQLIDKCPRFERKGKTVPYTSANGHMFSLLNKAGEVGMRFPKPVQEQYIEEFGSSKFRSHGAEMRGYVLIPDHMLDDLDKLSEYLNESYDYVMSLALNNVRLSRVCVMDLLITLDRYYLQQPPSCLPHERRLT